MESFLQNVLLVTEMMNRATHSPFMLGTLDAKIYNIDKDDYRVCKWYELENVRYFYDFFKKREDEFEEK